MPPWLMPIFGFLKPILDKFFPDKAQQLQFQLELQQLAASSQGAQLNADLQVALAQIGVNQTEAASPSLFKGGWRPYTGWTCATGLSYQFIVRPLLAWVSKAFWHVPEPPELDLSTLIPLLGAMLGLTAARTTERINGVIPAGQ